MNKLLPVLLALLGLGVGGGAGYFLKPKDTDHPTETAEKAEATDETETPPEFAKLSNQFVVPILESGRIVSMVVLSLSLEVSAGLSEAVFSAEPKLRDEMLQVLFDHANSGGFRGTFTDANTLIPLRTALLETAQKLLGDGVRDILITEIIRQDN